MIDLKSLIEQSSYIVFFGGAGVSTESNIPDFRSNNGIYQQHKYPYPSEYMLSHDLFIKDTKAFYDFYYHEMLYPDALPNDAHKALSSLEASGKLKAIITQNIDGLHQLAGSKNVYELHGSVLRNYCLKCHKFYPLAKIMEAKGNIPYCDCGGIIKPDVVLYQEGLDSNTLRQAIDHIQKADLIIVGGTSLVVYPAAGLLEYFNGEHLVLINRDQTSYDHKAELVIHDSIGKVLKEAIK